MSSTGDPLASEITVRRIESARLGHRVREAGGGPLVVFMHGITANAAVWDPITERLASDYRVISIDQRGHGGSDRPAADDGAYTGEAYALDAIALVEMLGVDRAFLVGHSLGARNAIVAGHLRPDLIAAVVAIDFTPRIEPEVFDSLAARVSGGNRTFAAVEDIVAYLRDRYPRIPDDALRRRAEHGYRAGDDGLRPLADADALDATAAGLREDFERAFVESTVPTLLIRGSDSKLVSREAWAATKLLRPDIAAIEVAGADHYVPEEAPDVVAAAIREFLGRVG